MSGLASPAAYADSDRITETVFLPGKFTSEYIDTMLQESSKITDPGERIKFLSERFIGTEYEGSTLIGSVDEQEVLTINLEGMDCFTFQDYVEALRLSSDFKEFKYNLVDVRYRDSEIDYTKRNHFFTDWGVYNRNNVTDITQLIGGQNTKKVTKQLNKKEDGTRFLPGIPVVEREITYIPGSSIDSTVLSELRDGDYIGIYTHTNGLDVSHTGIVVIKSGEPYIRHASSRKKNRMVLDEPLEKYMKDRPGLIVLRPGGNH